MQIKGSFVIITIKKTNRGEGTKNVWVVSSAASVCESALELCNMLFKPMRVCTMQLKIYIRYILERDLKL